MAGRYGGKKITTRGLTILKVDSEHNLLVVEGIRARQAWRAAQHPPGLARGRQARQRR